MAARNKGWDVIGVSLTDVGLADYLKKVDLSMPIYHSPSSATRAAYRFGGTPATAVIGADGRILHAWPGAYGGPVKQRVEEALSITLPGIASTDD